MGQAAAGEFPYACPGVPRGWIVLLGPALAHPRTHGTHGEVVQTAGRVTNILTPRTYLLSNFPIAKTGTNPGWSTPKAQVFHLSFSEYCFSLSPNSRERLVGIDMTLFRNDDSNSKNKETYVYQTRQLASNIILSLTKKALEPFAP